MRLSPVPLCIAMVVAGSSVWFVVSTLVMDELPDAALVGIALVVAVAFVSAFAGTPVLSRVRAAGRREVLLAAATGVLTWLAPFLLVLTQRATDAPSGTETLFFTTAGWMLSGLVVALAFPEERPTGIGSAGVLLALLGSAALLANWERPSSFSPFIKFPVPEMLMLLAGVLFAAGLVLSRRSARIMGTRTALWIGVASAAGIAMLVALPTGFGPLAVYARLWPQLLLSGAALATLATGITGLSNSLGVARATSWLVLTPLALTGLWVVERISGAYGPNPIVWIGASGGAALVVAGLLVAQVRAVPSIPRSVSAAEKSRGVTLAAALAAAVAAGVGAASLLLPAFSASVSGSMDTGEAFTAQWTLIGAESVVGWLPVCAGLLALAAAIDLRRRGVNRGVIVAAVSGLIALATYPLVIATPLHTWNRWIPAVVQQAYGTEYARLTMDVVPDAVRLAAVGLAAVACVTLIIIAILGRSGDGAVVTRAPEENE